MTDEKENTATEPTWPGGGIVVAYDARDLENDSTIAVPKLSVFDNNALAAHNSAPPAIALRLRHLN